MTEPQVKTKVLRKTSLLEVAFHARLLGRYVDTNIRFVVQVDVLPPDLQDLAKRIGDSGALLDYCYGLYRTKTLAVTASPDESFTMRADALATHLSSLGCAYVNVVSQTQDLKCGARVIIEHQHIQ